MAECLFCRIAKREIPATVVAETDGLLAFKDITPQAPVHLLIIPTEHIASLADLAPRHTELAGRAMQFANRLAKDQQLTGGYRVVANCGPDAGQSVAHLHWHVLGGRRLQWPPG